MNSAEMRKTKLPEGMMFENQSKLGSKPNWKMIPICPEKHPTFHREMMRKREVLNP